MRAQAKQVRQEEEEESAFVSMTDMTVGFLFIMMILLAFFASQVGEKETVSKRSFDEMVDQRNHWREKAQRLEALLEELTSQVIAKDTEIARLKKRLANQQQFDPLETYLAKASNARREVLVRLRDAILKDFPDLKVELSEESDALRFQGEGLFVEGRSDLTEEKSRIVSRLATRLDEILPCFTLGPSSRFDDTCNPSFAMIEAVQIEGHTDSSGSDMTNRNLSTARANTTFSTMTTSVENVRQHLNFKNQPVLSVAAYGPDRPVASNETEEGRATNRRIDLRFIMVTPRDVDGIELIRNKFRGLGEAVQ